MPNSERTNIDVKSILTGVITSILVSAGTFVWFMGSLDNRVKNLEDGTNKVDIVIDKMNVLSQNIAVLSTDVNYVKENMKDLKANSTILGNDVRDLRNKVETMQREENK